jgi:hypothetical protein
MPELYNIEITSYAHFRCSGCEKDKRETAFILAGNGPQIGIWCVPCFNKEIRPNLKIPK